MSVWLRRIKNGPTQIGIGQVITKETDLIQVGHDVTFEWLLRSGRWEVDDRPRCESCADVLPPGARHCIACGYVVDEDALIPEEPIYPTTGATQQL